jgi:uncharacterized protein with PIN domain
VLRGYQKAVTVHILFNGDLPELLPLKKRKKNLIIDCVCKRSVKDLIQSLGVPHTEVGEILVNNQKVDSSYLLLGDEKVEVFPVPVPAESHLQPVNNDPPRLICDVHLWKLARRLRLLGFDTWFDQRWDDEELADIAHRERLILLTRDRGLLKRNKVEQGLLIRNTDPEKQVIEILQRLGIGKIVNPFTRCLLCSGILKPASWEDEFFQKKLKPQIPAKVLEWCSEYHFCVSCEKVFWKGSHYKKLTRLIKKYLSE